jgi:hypothetical protein
MNGRDESLIKAKNSSHINITAAGVCMSRIIDDKLKGTRKKKI